MTITLPTNWTRSSTTITIPASAAAGDYNIKVTPDSNHKWSSDNSTTVKNLSFTINSATMTKPSAAKTSFTYSGSAQTLISNFDTNKMTATVKVGSGTASSTTSVSQTNANTYTYSFTPKAGYAWSDDTTSAVTVTVTIAKYNLSSSTVTLGTTSYTYDGTAKKPSVSSVTMGSTTIASSNYTVSYSDNTAASTTAKVTVTATEGNANFTGSKTVNFTINSATMTKPSACLLYTSPSPRALSTYRMPYSA